MYWTACLLLGVSGCERAPLPEYVVSPDISELSTTHAKQIAGNLERYFGNPMNPHLRIPDPAAAQAEPPEGQEGEPLVTLVDSVAPLHLKHGAEVYRARCAGCHGVSGDGQGEAAVYLQPKPRDYRPGKFKFTSTPYGRKPARQDLVRTIRRGAKGTSMPAFPWMSQEDLNAVIDYVMVLSERGELEKYMARTAAEYDEEETIEQAVFDEGLDFIRNSWADAERMIVHPVTAEPEFSDASIIAGRQAYLVKGCSKCHGPDAKGQTEWLNPAVLARLEKENVKINLDEWGHPAPAADLTARLLHGGRRPIDIYRRIYTGINGTPMPNFGDALAAEPETIWNLVHYVLSIVEGRQVDFPAPPTATEPAAPAETGPAAAAP